MEVISKIAKIGSVWPALKMRVIKLFIQRVARTFMKTVTTKVWSKIVATKAK